MSDRGQRSSEAQGTLQGESPTISNSGPKGMPHCFAISSSRVPRCQIHPASHSLVIEKAIGYVR